ncbi:MAG: formylglycine-generating enzyme family protein [Puniceicoccaceae bacterium]|nr:MAG: formylglycine-generating enzyme family protein [Puniceicoccaceae bacterium]
MTITISPIFLRCLLVCASLTLFGSSPAAASWAILEIDQSQDGMQTWETLRFTPYMITPDGKLIVSNLEVGREAFFRVRLAEQDFSFAEQFVTIMPGTYFRGSPGDELGRSGADPGTFSHERQHSVTLTRAFKLLKTPVTWRQWAMVKDWAVYNGYTFATPGRKGSHGDERNTEDDPVTAMNWRDAILWSNALSEMNRLEPCYRWVGSGFDGQVIRSWVGGDWVCDFDANGFRLPTEAEWEYAARAGTTTATYNGDLTVLGTEVVDPALDAIAWYGANSGGQTHPVGGKQPNPWGLYDMLGNVLEIVFDASTGNVYPDPDAMDGPLVDPIGPIAPVSLRVVRGGGYNQTPGLVRAAARDFWVTGSGRIGFRIARTAHLPLTAE